jgi:hypothetical protein
MGPGGPLAIRTAVPVPNPDPESLDVEMEGTGDGVVLTAFTKAMTVVAKAEVVRSLNVGWNRVYLGTLLEDLPNGIYFVRLQALRGALTSPAVVVKVFVLRR